MNIAEIESELRELVEKPFDPESFVFEFLRIYDAPKATVTKLRQAQGGDLLQSGEVVWKKKLWFQPTQTGKAAAAIDAMAADPGKQAPRFLIATDGVEFYARDTKSDLNIDPEFAKLNDSFDFFLPLANIERYEGVAENPADIKATARLAKLYDAILEANPDWIGADRTHDLNIFMTRMLFCFFAEGTSIFDKGLFTSTLMTVSQEDGSDLSQALGTLFAAMNTDGKERAGMPEFAKRFPYVNGGLFRDKALIPKFSKRARRLLRECGELAWSHINPDIFGSMIQAVVEPGMRGDMGMHYTSVPNIMKVLHPLFLMSLEEEFEAARDSEAKLVKLLRRIQNIRVFDPACGSGNFLIIAYRELRKLENRIFERQWEIGQRSIPMTGVSLTQFCGIELADFAAETAKLSLWIAEYQMNEQFKAEFGAAPPALPLRDNGNILRGNACREDWKKVCPPDSDREIYVVGNPPYLGSVHQTDEQKEDMRRVFSPLLSKYKDLDFVAVWFITAAHYIQSTGAQAAFVSTNSITQGEQVAMLWPLVASAGVEIGFAHLSFKWANSAANNAGVTCVVVGLRRRSSAPKFIFDAGLSRRVKNINAYLIAADDVIVEKRAKQISALPKMDYGNKPTDGGNFILSRDERDELITAYPASRALIRRYTGSREFIQGVERWCLWIEDENLDAAMSIPPIAERIGNVKTLRLKSGGLQANANASTPHRFVYTPHKDKENILVPCHFSERRPYLTVGFSNGLDEIVGNSAAVIFDAPAYVLAILSTRMHLLWTASVGGQLETRLRYSNTLVYNSFPLPALSEDQLSELEDHASQILTVREGHPGKTIAWLYDPETMPEDLLAAHRELDNSIERMCIGRPFKTDAERLEYLFKQYTLMRQKADSGGTRSLAFKGRKQ
jgi:hypothetical protein